MGVLRPCGVDSDACGPAWPGLELEPGMEPSLLAVGHLLLTPVGTDEDRPTAWCPIHFPCLLLTTFFVGDGVSLLRELV